MGSIEVYDYEQQRWVPYVADPEAWYQHFKDLRDGYVQPDHRGRYVVGSAKKEKMEQTQPIVKLVTPVAQANEIAQSEVNREKQRKNTENKKRKNTTPPLPNSKRRRTIYDLESAL